MKAAVGQCPVGPVDMQVANFEPDALGVGDGDAVDGEIIEQIALDAFNAQIAKPADLLAGGNAGDQVPPGLG